MCTEIRLSRPRLSQVFRGPHLLLFGRQSGCCILQVDYRKYVAVNLATAHPHYDAAGNVLNMGTSIVDNGRTKYVMFKIPATAPGRSLWDLTKQRQLNDPR